MSIVGREREMSELRFYQDTDKSEFVALYGRRRIGKTFLVREMFREEFAFSHTGLSPYDTRSKIGRTEQLEHFYHSLLEYGIEESTCPTTWLEAFYMLEQLLTDKSNGKKQIVFIDELPWMDTQGAGFVTALEAFWNGWAVDKNIYLIVCGSATSWMLNNLINNKGGLYNRLSAEIHLSAFTLRECEAFFSQRGLKISRYDIVQAYMLFGGIPYYLDKFRKGLSLAQNVDSILFAHHSRLSGEFERLFGSLFQKPEKYIDIIRLLSKRRYGYTREEIIKHLDLKSGAGLSKILLALESSEFIVKYKAFDAQRNETLYRLSDAYCIAYLTFLDNNRNIDEQFWQHSQNSPYINTWRGLAFENVCMEHIRQIKQSLGISGVLSEESVWTLRGKNTTKGTQVDLVMSRKDNVVNMCEIKFSTSEYKISDDYEMVIRNRISALSERLRATQVVHVTFITTFGVSQNAHSGIIQNVLTLNDLFSC